MKYRKLRIAWSVAWGVVALLLCVLWVRSYWRWEEVHYRYYTPYSISLVSLAGNVALETMVDEPNRAHAYGSLPVEYWGPAVEFYSSEFDYRSESQVVSDRLMRALVIPHWVVAIVTLLLTAAPWLPFRFSLRTLLIATALVAVGLSLLVWAAR